MLLVRSSAAVSDTAAVVVGVFELLVCSNAAVSDTAAPTLLTSWGVRSSRGQVVAQCLEGAGPLVARRTLTLAAVNVVYVVPIVTALYAINDMLVRRFKVRSGWRRTGFMVAFDQIVGAPIAITGFFCAFQAASAASDALATGAPFALHAIASSAHTTLRTTLASTLVSNWRLKDGHAPPLHRSAGGRL